MVSTVLQLKPNPYTYWGKSNAQAQSAANNLFLVTSKNRKLSPSQNLKITIAISDICIQPLHCCQVFRECVSTGDRRFI